MDLVIGLATAQTSGDAGADERYATKGVVRASAQGHGSAIAIGHHRYDGREAPGAQLPAESLRRAWLLLDA